MTRSSRHRSHRSHKHSRDRSDSEENESPRERRTRDEESARGSRDPELEKRRSSHEHSGKELADASNGDSSGEKKRKAREDDVAVVVADRWNGGEENDHKRSKGAPFGPMELDKSSKLKDADSKGRSSRRHEGLNERDEECGGKHEPTKGKSEKDSGRRESSSQYKDGKERERDKDREVQDSRHGKSDDLHDRKHGSEELASKKHTKINERQTQDLQTAETEKGLEKHTRRDDPEDKDKCLDESRDFDDRRLSSRDDHSKNRHYRDERHEDTKYRGKYKIDNDGDQKYHDDKYQDEWSSKDRTTDKSDKCHLRDENKPLQSHYRKAKLLDSDHGGTSHVDDLDTKFKDSRGRKRYSDEKEDHGDLKLRGAKERREIVEKIALSNSRTGSRNDKSRPEYHHQEKADSSPRNNRLKRSTSSSAYAGKDHNRDFLKLAESAHRESAPEERLCSVAASKGDTSSGLRDKISGTRSGKVTLKDDFQSGEHFVETAASKYDRTPRSDARTSPNQSKGRSPSANSGRRLSERSPLEYDRTAKQRIDVEIGQRSSSSKDGDRGELALEKPMLDDIPQTDVCARESTPVGSSSINRSGYLSDWSPKHLRPPSLIRLGMDSPSVLGPYQDDNKAQSNDRRSYNRNRRIGDLGFGRGQGNSWKGAPNWSSPVTNGFIPLQHGPPPAGFHPAMSQFSASPLFGVRPPMDLSHGGVSYHMHDVAERFSGHGQPFGWHNPVDQRCHPHMQMWDRSNSMLNNESHIYGRQEWDENSQLMGSRGWEMGSEKWKGQNGNNMDIPVFKKEQESSTHFPSDELAQSKRLPTECIGTKQSSDIPPAKSDVESPQKTATKKTTEPSDMPGDRITNHGTYYLSRIDISSNLAGSELYQRCTSLLGKMNVNDAHSLATYGCFQTNKGGGLVKMERGSSTLNSFFPTAKDDIFKRAISLYRKQNKRLNVKHAVSAPVYSDEKKKESAENDIVQGGADLASLEKTPLSDANPANYMKAGNNTVEQDSDCPCSAKDQKSDIDSGGVVYCNGADSSEALVEECSGASQSRIPNSIENTH